MAQNMIGKIVDLAAAVQDCELSSNRSPIASSFFGRCCQTGRGVPISFTLAAESFQNAADSNDADGANSFGRCLELGEGVEQDIDRSVRYYRKVASQFHPAGLYNFGRCLEYGKGINPGFASSSEILSFVSPTEKSHGGEQFMESVSNGELEFDQIYHLQLSITNDQLFKAILMAQIISDSASSMVVVSNKTSNQQLNVINLREIMVIPKLN
jgi:hypothetical protein